MRLLVCITLTLVILGTVQAGPVGDELTNRRRGKEREGQMPPNSRTEENRPDTGDNEVVDTGPATEPMTTDGPSYASMLRHGATLTGNCCQQTAETCSNCAARLAEAGIDTCECVGGKKETRDDLEDLYLRATSRRHKSRVDPMCLCDGYPCALLYHRSTLLVGDTILLVLHAP
ncbi:hypothetical protein IWQ60_006377 [Tieghemiomyces parasiticus]|uniref:Uncharacterized protein n=1 Tax=Tieghemiomyces parasiticus TaxID=78921 RepID=A0A9W8AD56_9FUNG|nr:hypothetical protein IWQ60_006377 [Tieghemiomyces parasiticus]